MTTSLSSRASGLALAVAYLGCGGAQLGQSPRTGDEPAAAVLPEQELTQFVNPLIGTAASDAPNPVPGGSGGSTFPGAAAPFGMVQWSPDTPESEPSGYGYKDSIITGFSLTHYSGAGCANNGDLPILPALDPAAPPARFRHEQERAAAGSYDVTFDSGIRVELTATPRTGFGRFTFPASGEQVVIVDASRNAMIRQTDAEVKPDGKTGLVGYTTGGRFCSSNNIYRLYFAIEVDRPFAKVAIDHGRAVLQFDRRGGAAVLMKVGISFVSVDNARRNLRAESDGWAFDATRDAARRSWNRRLNAIQVTGGSQDDRVKLYTALYHSLLFPNVFSDVNGEYVGFDKQIHTMPSGRTKYANYSGWDIYRSQVQLLAMLFPDETSDMMQSLVLDAQQCGALPKWSQNNDETGVMVGDPGALIVASSHAFGARAFDHAAALAIMVRTGNNGGPGCNGRPPMPGLRSYLINGYIAESDWGPASTTLEYVSRDFAVAQLAAQLGDEVSHRRLMGRSAYWQALLHPSGFIENRTPDGAWKQPLAGPGDGSNTLYVEGNAEQYTWMIPHDPHTLFTALGGNDAVVARLDRFFSRLNAGLSDPYFYMGNEPNFATPWLYNWAGAPWRTQDVVRRIVDESFQASPGGLPGNDDLGATSSWLVFAAIGLYPSIPGVAGLAIGSPLFPETAVQLGGARVLSIRAQGAPRRYVQSLTVNGRPHTTPWLDYASLKDRAELSFVLGDAPSKWGSAPGDAPPSFGPGTFTRLEDAFNDRGISDDGGRDDANFDGTGATYSRQALSAAGARPGATLSAAGATFTWPPAAPLDHLVAVGQTVRVAPATRGRTLALLGAGSYGPAQGTAILTYADGTTSRVELGFSDWTLGGGKDKPSFDNQIAVKTPYRNTRLGRDPVAAFLFAATVALDPARELVSLTLPSRVSKGKMHVFGMTVVP